VSEVDPTTAQVVGMALVNVAEAMGAALVRTAVSPNIKERRDCSAAVFAADGRLVAQAEHIPLHLGSLLGVVDHVLERHGLRGIGPGDLFCANDPYVAGGTHLPDVTLVAPAFADDQLLGFVAAIAHHADIGGRVPGGIAGDSGSIHEEGIRIPPVRLARGGQLDPDLVDLICLNCRLPDQRRTDLEAQAAACRLGVRRLGELSRNYSAPTLWAAMDFSLRRAAARLRQALDDVPDGSYTARDRLDDDGAGGDPPSIEVTVTIKGQEMVVDFAGTTPQVPTAINVPSSALLATVMYAVKAGLDPELPANGGFFAVVSIKAPEGSLLNPRPPAAVGARTDTCQRVAGTLLAALGQALPGRLPAPANDASTAVVFAREAGGSQEPFVYVEAVAGGGGGGPHADGDDGIQVHVTNTSNLPVEALELEYPLRVERYALADGSGGPGRWRGGRGLVRDVRVLADGVTFSSHGDRHRFPAPGAHGGEPGGLGGFWVNPGTEGERRLASKTSGVRLNAGDLVRVRTPGGGGYGAERSRS